MYEQILSLYNTGNYSRFNYVTFVMILLRLSKSAYNNVVKTIGCVLTDLINTTNNYVYHKSLTLYIYILNIYSHRKNFIFI